jgi:uncharacterized protein (TIGR00290 family)
VKRVPPAVSVPTLLSWSTGKDAAYSLRILRHGGEFNVVGLLTAVNESDGTVISHGIAAELLHRQASSIGLPLMTFEIPQPCPNRLYEERLGAALQRPREDRVQLVAFGDLFLEDVRRYREAVLERFGMRCLFPLWHRKTDRLAREMIASGLRARVVRVDERKLPVTLAGNEFDARFLASLPPGVDPCGENGEFHTFVTNSPDFREEVHLTPRPNGNR